MIDWSACAVVESVPGRCGGEPVLRHSRMRADFVFENYLLGMTVEEQVEQYGLDPADIKDVTEYAVEKYIENRQHEDNLRYERALGSTQAA